MSIELSVDAVIPQQPAPAADQTMQVQMPANALPGSIVQFMGPGGNKVEIVVPPYAIPGTVLTIEVPGAVPAPAAPAVADPAYSAAARIEAPVAQPRPATMTQDGVILGDDEYSSPEEANIVRLSLRTEINFHELCCVIHQSKDTVFTFDLNVAQQIFHVLDETKSNSITLPELIAGLQTPAIQSFIAESHVPLLEGMYNKDGSICIKKITNAMGKLDKSHNDAIDASEWSSFLSSLREKRILYYRRAFLLKARHYGGRGMEPGDRYNRFHKKLGLPRGFLDDFNAFVMNNHPLLAMMFADKEHPFNRMEKMVDFTTALMLTLVMSGYVNSVNSCDADIDDENCADDDADECGCRPINPDEIFWLSLPLVTLPVLVLHELARLNFTCPCLLHDESASGFVRNYASDAVEWIGTACGCVFACVALICMIAGIFIWVEVGGASFYWFVVNTVQTWVIWIILRGFLDFFPFESVVPYFCWLSKMSCGVLEVGTWYRERAFVFETIEEKVKLRGETSFFLPVDDVVVHSPL